MIERLRRFTLVGLILLVVTAGTASPAFAADVQAPDPLRVRAAIAVDCRTGDVLWEKNAREPRAIASLTKLMTALVFLDLNPVLSDSIRIIMKDVIGGGRSHVRGQNMVSLENLLRCSLISSDNGATRALARSTGLSREEFVSLMNRRARAMGLDDTRYADVTGLSDLNRSTAYDQARLLYSASQVSLIRKLTTTHSYSFRCSRRTETLNNTNRLLKSRSDIVTGKTGFITPAGYCLAALVGDGRNSLVSTVVLGARTSGARFRESNTLINWALNAAGSPRAPAVQGLPKDDTE